MNSERSDATSEAEGPARRHVPRRDVLKAAGASGVTASLAGCASIGRATDSNTLQWYAGSNEADQSDRIVQLLYDAGLSQDVDIEIIAGPANSSQKQQQVQRWLNAGLEKPDIVQMDSGWTIPFIARDQVLNLSESERFPDEFERLVEEEFFQSSVQTVSDPETGDLYGVPNFVDFAAMLYRRDLVEAAGYDPSAENWATESITWQEFSRVVRDALDEADDVDYGFTFQAATYEGLSCCDFNEFMSSWGGAYFGGLDTLFGPIGERPITIDSEPVVDAMRMVRTFIDGPDSEHGLDEFAGPIAPSAVRSWIEDSSLAPFTAGNAVAHRNWSYAIAQAGADDALGDRLGVMPLPYAVTEEESEYEGIGGPTSALGGWHNTINPNSDMIEEAVEVLRAMATPEFMLRQFENIGFIPPRPAVLDSEAAREIPIVGNFVDQLQVAGENAIPRPVTVVWPQESTIIAQSVNGALGGSPAPERAAASLAESIDEIETYNQDGT